MTPDEINTLIATKVMGHIEHDDPNKGFMRDADGSLWFGLDRYDPYHNAEQAEVALRTYIASIGEWAAADIAFARRAICRVFNNGEILGTGGGDTIPAAICNALCEAVKDE